MDLCSPCSSPEVERDTVLRQLAENGGAEQALSPAIHLMSYYRERYGHRPWELPVCEDVAARSLALPFFPEMSAGQVERVAGELVRGAGAVEPGGRFRGDPWHVAANTAVGAGLGSRWHG